MHRLQNEIKKWQDKHDMTVKDLQMRESAFHRIEVELDCAKTDLERAKLQSEKSENQHQLQVNHSKKKLNTMKCNQITNHAEINF